MSTSISFTVIQGSIERWRISQNKSPWTQQIYSNHLQTMSLFINMVCFWSVGDCGILFEKI